MDLRERRSTVTTRHPWETVRARFFTRVLAQPGVASALDVLDVGAGDGFVAGELLRALPPGSRVTCVDSEYTPEHLAMLSSGAQPGLSFSRTAPEREFDAIVLLDVLEHIEDDHGFLRDFISPRMKAGGSLLISVPAHQVLYTQHDVALGHQRRYSNRTLRATLDAAGFRTRVCGSLFGSLLLPRGIAKLLERARGVRSAPATMAPPNQVSTGVSVWPHGPIVTNAIRGALEIDARLCEVAARYSAPSAGLSVWALCERSH